MSPTLETHVPWKHTWAFYGTYEYECKILNIAFLVLQCYARYELYFWCSSATQGMNYISGAPVLRKV